jgi:hypothetical protein
MLVVGVLSIMTEHPVRESLVQHVKIQARETHPMRLRLARGVMRLQVELEASESFCALAAIVGL